MVVGDARGTDEVVGKYDPEWEFEVETDGVDEEDEAEWEVEVETDGVDEDNNVVDAECAGVIMGIANKSANESTHVKGARAREIGARALGDVEDEWEEDAEEGSGKRIAGDGPLDNLDMVVGYGDTLQNHSSVSVRTFRVVL